MSLKTFLAELRHRGVLKVAAAYLATGWVVLEGVSILFHNFEAPHWVLKVFSTLVVLGFPLACLIAWGFEFTPQGVRPVPASRSDSPTTPSRGDSFLAAILLVVFAFVTASLVQHWRDSTRKTGVRPSVPVVVVMDTSAPHGVYDQDTRDSSGTNADVLSEILRGLPIVIHKETIGATWDREDQVLKQRPNLIVIHRSAFFHSMNQELGFGYPDEPGFDEVRARRLYEIAQDKLCAFLGFIGQEDPDTVFLVYGRGTGGDWEDEQDRTSWVERLEGRFPSLKGRVTTVAVPGGVSRGSLHDEKTRQIFRQRVQTLLRLDKANSS